MTTEAMEKPQQVDVTRTERTRGGRTYLPNVDIVETEQELLVRADMPGTRGEDIDVNFENGVLTIHGKVRDRRREQATLVHGEYGVGDFYRTFQVSEKIDASRISADFALGVLTLHLPKAEEAKARRIEVKPA